MTSNMNHFFFFSQLHLYLVHQLKGLRQCIYSLSLLAAITSESMCFPNSVHYMLRRISQMGGDEPPVLLCHWKEVPQQHMQYLHRCWLHILSHVGTCGGCCIQFKRVTSASSATLQGAMSEDTILKPPI